MPRVFLIALSMCACAAHSFLADGSELCTPENPLRVISYNVQFLPAPVARQNERPQAAYRAERIAEEMGAYHIVGLQETYHPRHRRSIVREMRRLWDGELNRLESSRAGNHITNGGCLILTRLPFAATNTIIFETYSRSREYWLRADGWAAKGVIHARIATRIGDGAPSIDVYVTHLEARDDALRPRQYEEMARFISGTSDDDLPFLLIGDLNTDGGIEAREDPESQYTILMALLRGACAQAEIVDVWPSLHPEALGGTTKQESSDTGKRIDYIIVGNPPPPARRLKAEAVAVRLFQDPVVGALSDHNAVEASFVWEE